MTAMDPSNYLYYVTDKHERFAVWRHGITIKMKAEKIPFNIHWLRRKQAEQEFEKTSASVN